MEGQPRILVGEDDVRLVQMLTEILEPEGYAVTAAHDGQRALHECLTRDFDVLLLERGLPAIEELDVLARLRSRGVAVPALVLSALGNPSDRVEGLGRGAVLPVPGGMFHAAGRPVTQNGGTVVVLSERESALLGVLARRPLQVFPREQLHDLVFPDADDGGVVDTHVHYLRRKLGKPSVLTVRGIGYRLGKAA
ncbi:MAG: response regulator transcription factor [Arthrobacter sp.]